ncbi:hypothetical protein GW17_00055290 [Ensete ventricosum]|nr:hypothetical protein GW17_00055290 [Ensete ventricosum]
MAGACWRRQHPRPGRKGWLPTARPQEAAARCEAARSSPATRAIACKGDRSYRGSARARRHRPMAAAHVDDMQHRRLRRAATTTTQ